MKFKKLKLKKGMYVAHDDRYYIISAIIQLEQRISYAHIYIVDTEIFRCYSNKNE